MPHYVVTEGPLKGLRAATSKLATLKPPDLASVVDVAGVPILINKQHIKRVPIWKILLAMLARKLLWMPGAERIFLFNSIRVSFAITARLQIENSDLRNQVETLKKQRGLVSVN